MATENTPDTADAPTLAAAPATAELPLLDRIVLEGNMAVEPSQSGYAKQLIGQLATQILDEGMRTSPDKSVVAMIHERIAEIDALLSDQLNAIMHDPAFQQLEAAWTGLHDFVFGTQTSSRLKLRLLNVSKKDLLKDLENAVDHDMSVLFKKVYEDEYGTFGGIPYSLLIGDYQFGRHPKDIALLERISRVASAAHAPFVSGVSPSLFDLKSFTDMGVTRDLSKVFESAELAAWRHFRESEDSRYVCLVLPSYAARLPYGQAQQPVESFKFEEDVQDAEHGKYLWANAAYQLGLRITSAFAQYSWATAIRGVEGGGRVQGMAAHAYKTGEGDVAIKCPTEVTITDRREKELSDLGFVALVNAKGSGEATFFGSQTVNRPKVYNTPAANANAQLSARLPYVLAASRFAHYIKVIMRDKIGSFQSRADVERYLNNWIADYVLINPSASHEQKASYPLSEARVDVTEVAGRPGAYRATCFLKPHYQMEELTASIRLVADLPAAAA
ncbi:type VI secretion system contractile sheath large subunit [Bordetella hinzii]|uniref:type VI secretion system contractile sheath large subunit n=1 Tax=Bordetella hinzii TaxID=103855 RepID=UPI001C009C26|nr:type VI secretion system contractile sheath large subunit [Bordetella hinzii]QWF40669.1 type VI secretion system contractile sheath large subunit [Bordetella hinzii]QWF45216.1 type VI secretion system contractile sheath large subunit [Bordetella hinzii]QWF54287.1 type VI secretion system contractile sheath large subunit [Bordetella hinzii]QWF58780.1 type VI secretion system contractile sheath large subunit [Bordetella hinzii]